MIDDFNVQWIVTLLGKKCRLTTKINGKFIVGGKIAIEFVTDTNIHQIYKIVTTFVIELLGRKILGSEINHDYNYFLIYFFS